MNKSKESKTEPKRVEWNAQCKEDLSGFPDEVRAKIGHQLYLQQVGLGSVHIKKFTGGHGFSERNKAYQISVKGHAAYRLVFAIFSDAIYPLHAFTKSTEATATEDVEKVALRYHEAERLAKSRGDVKKEKIKYDARFGR